MDDQTGRAEPAIAIPEPVPAATCAVPSCSPLTPPLLGADAIDTPPGALAGGCVSSACHQEDLPSGLRVDGDVETRLIPRRRLHTACLRSLAGFPRGIVDRDLRVHLGSAEPIFVYRVQWQHAPGCPPFDDTWEPGSMLREDGFSGACDQVDRWRASDVADFSAYCAANPGDFLVGASHDGRCTFRALRCCLRQLDNASWMTPMLVDSFHAECASKGRPLSANGINTGILQCFVHFGNARVSGNARPLSVPTFKKNMCRGSVRGAAALDAIPLRDGVYICAAFDKMHQGHAFTILMRDGWKRVIDEDDYHASLFDYGVGWIFGVYFLRQVALC